MTRLAREVAQPLVRILGLEVQRHGGARLVALAVADLVRAVAGRLPQGGAVLPGAAGAAA